MTVPALSCTVIYMTTNTTHTLYPIASTPSVLRCRSMDTRTVAELRRNEHGYRELFVTIGSTPTYVGMVDPTTWNDDQLIGAVIDVEHRFSGQFNRFAMPTGAAYDIQPFGTEVWFDIV